jgi:hypothetical protein
MRFAVLLQSHPRSGDLQRARLPVSNLPPLEEIAWPQAGLRGPLAQESSAAENPVADHRRGSMEEGHCSHSHDTLQSEHISAQNGRRICVRRVIATH